MLTANETFVTNQINLTIFYPQTTQQKFVTQYSFEHFPNSDENDFESTHDPSDASNSAVEQLFDRRRKIRKHGCKHLSLIGPGSCFLIALRPFYEPLTFLTKKF